MPNRLSTILICLLVLTGCQGILPAIGSRSDAQGSHLSIVLTQSDINAFLNQYGVAQGWLSNPTLALAKDVLTLDAKIKQGDQWVAMRMTVRTGVSVAASPLLVTSLIWDGHAIPPDALTHVNVSLNQDIALFLGNAGSRLENLTIGAQGLSITLLSTTAPGQPRSLQVSPDPQGYLISVSVTTAQFRTLLLSAIDTNDKPWLLGAEIGLTTNQIRISGNLVQTPPKPPMPVVLSLQTVAAVNGPTLQISGLSFNGWETPVAWLGGLNDGIARALSSNANVHLVKLDVNDGGVSIVIHVNKTTR